MHRQSAHTMVERTTLVKAPLQVLTQLCFVLRCCLIWMEANLAACPGDNNAVVQLDVLGQQGLCKAGQCLATLCVSLHGHLLAACWLPVIGLVSPSGVCSVKSLPSVPLREGVCENFNLL